MPIEISFDARKVTVLLANSQYPVFKSFGSRSRLPGPVGEYAKENRQAEIAESALTEYGLSQSESKVYLYLAMAGEKKASEIAQAISLHRTEVYRILRHLEKKGIVIEAFETPLRFGAVPLVKAVEQLLEIQRIKISLLDKRKTELIRFWESMPKRRVEEIEKEMFQMLEGQAEVLLKAEEMLDKATMDVKIFVPDHYLALLFNGNFFEKLEKRSFDVNVQLLTNDSLKSRLICEQLGWVAKGQLTCQVENLPCFTIIDGKMLLAIYSAEQRHKSQHIKKTRIEGFRTNSTALVASMLELFSHLDGQGAQKRNEASAIEPASV